MGGAVKKVGQEIGVIRKAAVAESPAARAVEAVKSSGASDDSSATRRRARRGARALLSEARLNPELGVGGQTLGSGPMA